MNNIKNDTYSNRTFDNKEDKSAFSKLDESYKQDCVKYNNYSQIDKLDEFKQKDAENK